MLVFVALTGSCGQTTNSDELDNTNNNVPTPPRVDDIRFSSRDPSGDEKDPDSIIWATDEAVYTYQLQREFDPDPEYQLLYRIRNASDKPDWLELDSISGTVTVDTGMAGDAIDDDPDASETVAVLEFYSSYNVDPEDDENGGSTYDVPLQVTFRVEKSDDL